MLVLIVTLFLTDSAIIYYVRLEVDYMSSLNRQSLGEEIANAVSHGIGALLAVLGTVVLIVYASYNSSVSGIVSAAIYGFCLIFLYLQATFSTNTAKQ